MTPFSNLFGEQADKQESIFLSRHAASLFWLARYLERAENLARLLDVTHIFSPASDNAQNWRSVIALHYDEAMFAKCYKEFSEENAIRFYLFDKRNTNSILSSVTQARDHASELRAMISTDMWVQLNVMYQQMLELSEKPFSLPGLSNLLARVRRNCQTHQGITDGGLYRDQGWYFYLLGQQLERAEQTSLLIDIKYHLLLPSPDDIGSPIDANQWFSVLRATNGYHAFRREHPHAITPVTVTSFLLRDRYFPRSLLFSLQTIRAALHELNEQHGLECSELVERAQLLVAELDEHTVQQFIEQGLHEWLDNMQKRMNELSSAIAEQYFS